LTRMAKMRPFVRDVLLKTYLFQNLTVDQINFLASMLEKQNLYRKDEVVIQEGDTDRSLFIIESGSVRLVRKGEDGESREVMKLGVGDLFGELSLITGLPRTASVIADENCVIFELTKESFDSLMSQFPPLRLKFALLVEQRIKETQKVADELKLSTNVRGGGKLMTEYRQSMPAKIN